MKKGDFNEKAFWEKIRKTSSCWEWKLGLDKGYGHTYYGGRVVGAHRAVYEMLVGPVPKGLQLDHLCRNRKCVNPKHLEPVTLRENILRGEWGGAKNARKTECSRGHKFDKKNTRIYTYQGHTWRGCKICQEQMRRLKSAKKV